MDVRSAGADVAAIERVIGVGPGGVEAMTSGREEAPPLTAKNEVTLSAREILANAETAAAAVGARQIGVRHVVAGYLYPPPSGMHADEFAAWKVDARRAATEFQKFIRPRHLDEAAGWLEIHSRHYDNAAEIESHAARARFANDLNCSRPVFAANNAPRLSLTNARHPLLELRMLAEARAAGTEPKQPTPLTVALEDDARQLIISGPNTGGKTVSLKTIGLLSLMAQAGVPVPADEAVLPLFTAVYADIGDAQSIERNLSSFSAHVVNLDRISREATSSSLVLLDELGSATDPEEGAALAVAVSRYFLDARVWSCITTHLTSLKIYAANHPGVLNAAVYGGGILAHRDDEGSPTTYGYRPAPQPVLDAVSAMRAVCARYGTDLPTAALQFSVRDETFASTIVGMSRPERIAPTVAAAQQPLPADLFAELETLLPARELWLDAPL